jgi:outer membrane receptor for ferrienterochelin and colicins
LKWQYGIRQAWNSSFQNPILPSMNALIKSGTNRFRMAYARGYRAPTLKELYFRFVDINHQLFGNPNLRAESSNYSEISWSRNEENFQIMTKVFDNDVVDRISLVDQLDGTFRYENIYRFHARGISLNADLTMDMVHLSSGVQFTGREQTINQSDNRADVLWTPEYTGSVEFQLVETLSFNLNAKYNGSQPRNVVDEQNEIIVQKSESYSMLDAQLRWQKSAWVAQVGVNNIFDVTTAQALQNGGAHSSGTTWLAWGRSVSITITHKLSAKRS